MDIRNIKIEKAYKRKKVQHMLVLMMSMGVAAGIMMAKPAYAASVRTGDTVTYSISYDNPSDEEKTIYITDEIPEHVTLLEDSISDNGKEDNGVIKWEINADAKEKGAVTFQATVNLEAAGTVLANNASVTLTEKTEDDKEEDVELPVRSEIKVEHNPAITATAENGTVDGASDNVARGSSAEITYKAKSGYIFKSVSVDRKRADAVKHLGSYVFEDVQESHELSAIFVEPKASVEVKPSTTAKTNDVVTFGITYENKTDVDRNIEIRNVIPYGTELVRGSVSEGGVPTDKMVNWSLVVPANTTGKVSFDLLILAESAGSSIKNTAEVTYKSINADMEDDVLIKLNSTINVVRNPMITTKISHGTITPSMYNVPRGTDQIIEYEPEDGYLLGDIWINNAKQELLYAHGRAIFESVIADRSVNVSCVKPEAYMTASMFKNRAGLDEYAATDVVAYKIRVTNPTSTIRVATITAAIPKGTTLVQEGLGEKTEIQKDKVIFRADVPAYGESFVEYHLKLNQDCAGKTLTNTAEVLYPKLDSSSEKDVVIKAESSIDVIANPKLTTKAVNGIITSSINAANRGEACEVTYQADAGYMLDKLIVDGQVVDIGKSVNSYVLENMQEDHDVVVEYKKPEVSKVVTFKDTKIKQENKTIAINKITIRNTSPVARTVEITDAIPEGSVLLPGSVNNKGKPDGEEVYWMIKVNPNSELTAQFSVVLDDPDKTDLDFDQAQVTFIEQPDDELLGDIVLKPETEVVEKGTTAVLTTVINGKISDSVYAKSDQGDIDIEYEPEDGFLVSKIIVNGQVQNITSTTNHIDGYSFAPVEGEINEIQVEYAQPTATLSTELKSSPGKLKSIVNGSVVTYSLNLTNPTFSKRNMVITMKVPEGTSVIKNTITDNGVLDGNELRWEFSLPAGAHKTIKFNVQAEHASAGHTVGAEAKVIMRKLDASNSEKDVEMVAKAAFNVTANPIIETSAEHGTITETNSDVERGSGFVVSYQPDEGYLLGSIMVDGESVDINANCDHYTFHNIQENHKIEVKFVKPELIKQIVIEDEEYKNVALIQNSRATYKLTVTNPTGVARRVVITDNVPQNVTLDTTSITEHGQLDADQETIEWVLTVPANGIGAVTYNTIVEDVQKEESSTSAHAVMSKMTRSELESDVQMEDEITTTMMQQPIITVVDKTQESAEGKMESIGADLVYKISVKNPTDEAQVTTIVDCVPDGFTVDANRISDGGVINGSNVVWTLPVEAKGEKSVSFVAKLGDNVEDGFALSNTATLTMNNISMPSEPSIIYAPIKPTLDILNEKGESVISKNQILMQSPGGELTYKITIANPTSDAMDFHAVDKIPESLILKSVGNGGSFNEEDRTISWDVHIDANESQTLEFVVGISEDAAGTSIIHNAIITNGKVYEGQTPKYEIPVLNVPVMTVVNNDTLEDIENAEIRCGERVTYTIRFTNPSNTEKDVKFKETLPEGFEFISADNAGKYNSSDNTVNWELTLAAGETATVKYAAAVNQDAYWVKETTLEDGSVVENAKSVINQACVSVDKATVKSTITENTLLPITRSLTIKNNMSQGGKIRTKAKYHVQFDNMEGVEVVLTGSKSYNNKRVVVGEEPLELSVGLGETLVIDEVPEGAVYTITYEVPEGYTTIVDGNESGQVASNTALSVLYVPDDPNAVDDSVLLETVQGDEEVMVPLQYILSGLAVAAVAVVVIDRIRQIGKKKKLQNQAADEGKWVEIPSETPSEASNAEMNPEPAETSEPNE